MKKTIAAVLLITATLGAFYACNFFDTKKHSSSANPLVGTWTFDSLRFGKDTANLPLEYALLVLAFKDSSKTYFQFSSDSIATLYGNGVDDKVGYLFLDSARQVVIIDSPQTKYSFEPLSDSTIALSKKDTFTMYLSKKASTLQ